MPKGKHKLMKAMGKNEKKLFAKRDRTKERDSFKKLDEKMQDRW